MATKLLVCPECGEAVGPGRFACASCGTVLASVAGAPRALGLVEDLAAPAGAAITAPESESPTEADAVADVIDAPAQPGPAWLRALSDQASDDSVVELLPDGVDNDWDAVADSVDASIAATPRPALRPRQARTPRRPRQFGIGAAAAQPAVAEFAAAA